MCMIHISSLRRLHGKGVVQGDLQNTVTPKFLKLILVYHLDLRNNPFRYAYILNEINNTK